MYKPTEEKFEAIDITIEFKGKTYKHRSKITRTVLLLAINPEDIITRETMNGVQRCIREALANDKE